jgi:membrane peptidoglycan carboxypeptidase
MHRYGEGSGTDLHFPGESPGLLPAPADWSGTTIDTVAFGQGLAVTAMQLAAAYNAVANGGVYVAPKLVSGTIDAHGRMQATPPSPTHRVISPQVAREMTAMLTEVTRAGTGTEAAIEGYQVAGKTGTAEKAVGSAYQTGAYYASFAGFVPATAPAFTALVVLDQPDNVFGGVTAAPVFHDIATYALREKQIPPPPPDPGLFAGVPHAQASAATAAAAAGGGGLGVFSPSVTGGLIDPPPPAYAPPTTTTTLPGATTTTLPGSPTTTLAGAGSTTTTGPPTATTSTTTTTRAPPPTTTTTTRPATTTTAVPPTTSTTRPATSTPSPTTTRPPATTRSPTTTTATASTASAAPAAGRDAVPAGRLTASPAPAHPPGAGTWLA